MKITLYFINWNDSFYLPFIKEHYGKFCRRIVMYDNYSTDGSEDLAKRLGFEVRLFGQRGQLNDQHYLDVKNHCWKESRGKADYVIVCDADEFLLQPEFYPITGSMPRVTGYNMVSDGLPLQSILEIKTGHKSEQYSKQAIFDPNKLIEIDYVHGCHLHHAKGELTLGTPLTLLHYRMIGGVNRLLERHTIYRERMSKFNLQHNMGHHYLHESGQKRLEWMHCQQQCETII